MVMRSLFLAAALAGAALAPGANAPAPAAAQTVQPGWIMPRGDGASWNGRPTEIQARVLPLRTLISMVQSQRGGQFVDVVGGLQQHGDRAFYIFRWRYPNGVEENIRVDAATGRVG